MKASRQLIAAAVVGILCLVSMSVKVDAAQNKSAGDLPVAVSIGLQETSGLRYLEVKNETNEFLCFKAAQFDTARPDLRIYDSNGHIAQLLNEAEPSFHDELGVDYSYAFILIKPRDYYEFYLDLRNYNLPTGNYVLKGVVAYYLCSDLIDTKRIRQHRRARAFAVNIDFPLLVPTSPP